MFKVWFTESFDLRHFVETSSRPSFASPVGRYPFHLFLAVFRDWIDFLLHHLEPKLDVKQDIVWNHPVGFVCC